MSAVTIDQTFAPVRLRPARPGVVVPFPLSRPARPAPTERPPLRITRRGRLAVTIGLALSLAAVSVVAASALVAAPPTTPAPPAGVGGQELRQVVVTPGDTLWGIASSTGVAGEDVRDVIAEIRELNGLETSAVMVGQELVVPSGG